jgi:mono/diheme cytochrome c family protein
MIEKYVDAEELKRLLSTLGIIVGCILIAGLFASIIVPGLRNANKPETPTAVTPVIGESGWLDLTEFPPQRGSVIPPVDPKTLISPSPELMLRGKDLFEANCTSCHGSQGRGDGPAAASMNPHPRNFTSADGWTNGYEIPNIFKTLSQGVNGTSMSPFDYLTKKDRRALAHYVQSLGKFPRKPANPEAMETLSKELASAGEKTPNRIPVSMAIAKLEEEFVNPPALAVGPEDHSPGAEVLRKAIAEPSRAAQVLVQSTAWRLSPRELASCVLLDVPGNGFSAGAAALDVSQWKELHAELLKRVKSK